MEVHEATTATSKKRETVQSLHMQNVGYSQSCGGAARVAVFLASANEQLHVPSAVRGQARGRRGRVLVISFEAARSHCGLK